MAAICVLVGCSDPHKEILGSWALTRLMDAQGTHEWSTNTNDNLLYEFSGDGTGSLTYPYEGGVLNAFQYKIHRRYLIVSDTNGLHGTNIPYKLSKDMLTLQSENGGELVFRRADKR